MKLISLMMVMSASIMLGCSESKQSTEKSESSDTAANVGMQKQVQENQEVIGPFDTKGQTKMKSPHEEADRGHYLKLDEKYDESIAALTYAIDHWDGEKQGLFICYWDRGISYDHCGRHELAIKDFSEAIKLEQSGYLYHARGIAHKNARDYSSSLRDFESAHKLIPNDPYTINYMIRLYSCSPNEEDRNGKLAMELVTDNYYDNPDMDDLMACASAEIGDFENAIKYAEANLEFWSNEKGNPSAKVEVELAKSRLESFRLKRPIRLPASSNQP